MERNRISGLGATLFAIMLAPLVALGQSGLYLGGDIGEVSVEEFFDDLEFDASNESWRLYGGYRFSDYLGLEAAYVNFGELDERVDIGAAFVPVAADAEGYSVGGIIGWPISDSLSLTGRGGLLFWNSENLVGAERFDESDENFFYGAGLRLDLSASLSITGDWIRYELDDIDAETISAGIQFRFR